MGKSRKYPGFTDNGHSHAFKKIASRKLRRKIKRGIDVPNGGSFKKYFCSYDICDYKFLAHTKQDLEHMKETYEGQEHKIFMK